MARSVRLRPWQQAALERLAATDGPDFLAVATPGAGKTTFALTAVRQDLAAHPARRVVVVAPTQHLKHQWARAAHAFALHLEPEWSAADGRLPPDMHGIVTTYQQVATSAGALRGLARDAVVVFDEIHHAADDRAWGDNLRSAFELAGRRIALSGTPFRSDTRAIPFVRYDDDEARPDFEYGYGDALRDGGVVRPVFFPRIDGRMEWTAPDGSVHEHTFEDPLDQARAGQRLRTALSVEGEWLPAVLRKAHEQLVAIRRTHERAGGLVIAIDQDHARGIAELMRRRLGVIATVATSDDPSASDRIARFADGDDPWIVAVRMVSEGVDIPRLRVGVFATNATTELFFRQAVGRLVRWTRGVPRQKAFMFIPDDPRLRSKAFQIADQRRHSLRRDERAEAGRTEQDEPVAETGQEEQLSLFAPISAVALGEPDLPPWELEDEAVADFDPDSPGLEITLPPPPVLQGAGAGATTVRTRREHKKHLRDANAEMARHLVRVTGLGHAAVNAELNRLTGIRRITEATIEQLEARLQHAERWMKRL